MATNQLALYKIACRALGERSVASLSESTEIRRLLDEVWDSGDGATRFFLEQGLWNHAMRAVSIDASSSVTPAFGLTNAFDIPSDFVRLSSISASEYFSEPLLDYREDTNYWYSNSDPIYVEYVSDDTSYGGDLSRWPETFVLWAGYWLATQVAPALKNDMDMQVLERRERQLLKDARSKDAQKDPTRFIPIQSWNRARFGRGQGRERGSRRQLIG